MKSKLLRQFREQFRLLPKEIRRLAKENYSLWSENPYHPSLRFKSVHPKSANVWSVRIGSDYRALALVEDDTAKWFWIGTHAEYMQILSNLKAVTKIQKK